ncbi:MAG: DeoR/GlpR family DNA-binding transcription regulator [Clostridiales bacterium]|nr:DeoR/GlpR family DNA-binding transcription regulator [Clostridiales bacterium]
MQKERRAMIREYIEFHGEATIAVLLALVGDCSSMTLWRDLNALEKEGFLRRTRGGAVSMSSIQPGVEGVYSRRAHENIEQKRLIARAALDFVKPGLSIYMDAGSTIMGLAKMLGNHHYTIITSGANTAIELTKNRNCNVIMVGGQISGNTLSCSGPQAQAVLNTVNIDTAVMATSGFSLATGFTSGMTSEHELKKKVIQKAQRTIMLMDHSKIGRTLPFTFAALADIDVLVTDRSLPPDIAGAAQSAGVEIILSKA